VIAVVMVNGGSLQYSIVAEAKGHSNQLTIRSSNFVISPFQRSLQLLPLRSSQRKLAQSKPALFVDLSLDSHEGTAMDMLLIMESQFKTWCAPSAD